MLLNKALKVIIVIVPILIITACSLKKANDKTYTKNNIVYHNSTMSAKQLAAHQMQELQNNNIIYFAFDKYNVTTEYEDILDQHASFLRKNPSLRIIIEGHTDERATPEYNIALGERRANAVKIYLQSKGVNNEQISIISYGKEKPVAMNHDETSYAKNRRAVLIY